MTEMISSRTARRPSLPIIHCPLGAGIVAGSITDGPILQYRSSNFEPGNAATEEGVITASQAPANSAARLGRGGRPMPVPAQLAAFRAALGGAVRVHRIPVAQEARPVFS